MERYKHAVFFEANHSLDIAQIQKYFQIKRKSGGGDCEILKLGVNTYKISFRDKEAQKRVLAQKDHVIHLQGQEELYISLRSDDIAERDKQTKASDQQTCASAKHMEKVFNVDRYLLRYLNECKNATSDLNQRLSKLSSSFHICMDSEKLVVVTEQQDKDSCPPKKWHLAVEEVLTDIQNHYILHFEVETDRLEILQENSFLLNENLKKYHEETLAVVVGKRENVEKITKFIDTLQAKKQDHRKCHISEKQLALVKEQFEQSRKSSFSNIEISQEKPGTVILKGPEKEVDAGEKELLNLVKVIEEKRIPLHHSIITFLESSGGIQLFQKRFQQSLRSPVMLEIAGLDLLLLSLTDGALTEAAAAVKRDMCFESLCLENTEKQSPGFITLKDNLNAAVQQANLGGVKVDVAFKESSNSTSPSINVEIVGYTHEVCRLKDILLEYKTNNENIHQSLPLPLPEMAEKFSDILSFVGLKSSTVKMDPTCSPSPCVQLTGPRWEVEGLKKNIETSLKGLVSKLYEVNGPGVQHFFHGDGSETLKLAKKSYGVQIIPVQRTQKSVQVPRNASTSSSQYSLPVVPRPDYGPKPMEVDYLDKDLHIQVVIGGLEEQQADVFVAPMINTKLTSTMIGSCLLEKGGQQFQTNFNNAKGQSTLTPGDVLEVDGTLTLGCSKVFFIECVPKSGEALHSGLARVLTLCEQQSCGSVALPIIGPGLALSIPVNDAVNILTREITIFFSGFTALFSSLTTDLDEIVTAESGTQVHLVLGDITNETTDVILNTTDFTTADFQTAQVQSGEIFKTQPGGFPCKQIMHVCGQKSASLIETLAKEIVVHCERDHYQSVAIPAICAGKGCMDPKEVAKSILQGVKNGIQGANLRYLKTVRIVLLKINVFLAFKEMAKQILGINTQLSVLGPLAPTRVTTRGRSSTTGGRDATTTRASRSLSLPIRNNNNLLLSLPAALAKAEFLVIGHTFDDVSNACTALKWEYENQCSSQSIASEDIKCLSADEINQLNSKVKSLHLHMQETSSGVYEVMGQKDGVNEVAGLIQGALRRQLRQLDQENLYGQVTWCILGQRGLWQKLSKDMNYKLEKGDVKDGIMDAQGVKWTVDLKNMVAKASGTRKKTKLKRLENHSDYSLPIYWDKMTPDEPVKVVNLDQSSTEYQKVKADFRKTVKQTVLKIERIQNVHLRRSYEVRTKEQENRNGPDGAEEKILYHGTTEEASKAIMDTNFNRRYAGQNATVYGVGTYFAVSASYSANPLYSIPKSDGTQLMFVARVLTGRYTQGQGTMKAPPNNFDSVVDKTQDPTIFVVFHDCQAYPDYLITFK
ncbi:TCDD-inducible poly [ADP-ribose] polymerase [Triplophysa tibetana]|uniref:Poly [ADP-ribose] polymerase n=1 Tax=Triplophysa tibetana TaxID=1572043 RepID=A0A5A9PPI9_9TELE|nr:TCDD-inducible poly [ADP-ribose] polymerase [Triplophysa tibetana]